MSTCSATQNLHHSGVRPKRRTITIAVLLCAAVAVAVVTINSRDDELRYKGKRLSEWLALYQSDVYGQQSPEFAQAEEAVRSIGTNALPYYLKWIRYEPPAWRQRLMRYLPTRVWDNETFQGLIESGDSKRASLAFLGLGMLGTNALAALPELQLMMKDGRAPRTSSRAILALGSMGESAIPTLRAALQDKNQTNRTQIVFSFRLMAIESGTNACLPYLLEALTNDNAAVRTAATRIVQSIAPKALSNTPAH